jgi:hypothetical protein
MNSAMFLLLWWIAACSKQREPVAITDTTNAWAPKGSFLHEFVLADIFVQVVAQLATRARDPTVKDSG